MDDTFEDEIRLSLPSRVNYTRAIDEENTSHERNVSPNFGLSGNWGDFTDLLGANGIDDGGLPNVWITDETDRDLLLIRVQLTDEHDQHKLVLQ